MPAAVMAKMQDKWHPLHNSEYLWCKSLLANLLLSMLGDRTEMAHSIEARTPFLDHVLSEYVNGIPPGLKVKYGAGEGSPGSGPGDGSRAPRGAFSEKWILREAGRPFVTDEIYQRKKHPYTAPLKWPRGGPMDRTLRQICT
jgi:asparagine synthase (glutamine-hydrolysing)